MHPTSIYLSPSTTAAYFIVVTRAVSAETLRANTKGSITPV
jgi:hypothetical protein